jgi:hypothetical protein
MADKTYQVQDLLSQVDLSMDELNELRRLFEERKSSILGQVESIASKLAHLADAQAVRATVLRQLYWSYDIPVDLLARAFGITAGRVRSIAGPLVIEKPCEGNCGSMIRKTFKSKHGAAQKSTWDGALCDSCMKKEQQAAIARAAAEERERKERHDYLVNLEWDEFIETPEWVDERNYLLHEKKFACEICHDRSRTLYIYPHKEIPYRCFVLCHDCVPRFDDLIIKDKCDVIRPELLRTIADTMTRGY